MSGFWSGRTVLITGISGFIGAWLAAALVERGTRVVGFDTGSGLPEVRVCTAYELDGRRVDAPPAFAGDWERCEPIYESFQGWDEDLGGVRQFEDLPQAAQTFVRAIQDLLDVPVEMISVGAERERFIALNQGIPVAI